MIAIVEPSLRPGRVGAVGAALALAALSALSPEASAWMLERANVSSQNGALVLQLECSDAAAEMTHDVFTLSDPPRVVVDLFGADAPLDVQASKATPGLVEVRSSLWKDDASGRIVRYVLETSELMSCQSSVANGCLSLMLAPVGAAIPPMEGKTSMDPYRALDAANANAKSNSNLGASKTVGATPDATPTTTKSVAPSADPAPVASIEAQDDESAPELQVQVPTITVKGTEEPSEANAPAASTGSSFASDPSAAADAAAAQAAAAEAAAAWGHDASMNASMKATEQADTGSDPAVAVDPLSPSAYDALLRVEDQSAASQPMPSAPRPAMGMAPPAQPQPVALPDFAATAMKYADPIPTRGRHGYYFPSTASADDPQDTAPISGRSDPRYVPNAPSEGFATSAMAQAGSATARDTRAMNLDVQSADLRTVFRSIAEFGGTNIVPDREIEGPVSIRLSEVPWRHALDIVCRSAGLIAIDGDGFIRVATIKAFRDEALDRESADRKREEFLPLETRIMHVDYANAEELRDVVVQSLSLRGRVEADPRTNSLIVSDIGNRLDQIGAMVENLDTETRQVEILAQLIDVDAAVSKQLGITWDLDNIHSTGERASASASVGEPIVAGSSGELRVGVVRDWGTFAATLEAFERSNKANIISNPKITTTNNRTAKILVGKEIPLIVLDERGNPITELKKVGITLEVTPFINTDSRITMDLHPEVSDLSSQATVTGGLIFTTAQADTRVMVNNGETAVIGGLVRTNETDFKQGIPILSDIPILGSLFRFSDDRDEKRELIILVTPSIVEPMATK